MKSIIIKNFRSTHKIFDLPMTEKELRELVSKKGTISGKVLVDFNDLVNNDFDWLNDVASEKLTGSICGLTEINFIVVGKTTINQVILKVTGTVEFDNL